MNSFYGSVIFITTAVTVFIVSLVFLYFRHAFSYWKRKNVPYLKPSIPLGNIDLSFYEKYGQVLVTLYNEFKKLNVKYAGLYIITMPVFFPVDSEVIKGILTKGFHHFHDRGMYVNEEREPLTGHLFALGGEKWKNLRAKLTHNFTSNKLKSMFLTMLQCGEDLQNVMRRPAENAEKIDIKELCSQFTTDIIGSCAFGIECNSLKDPDAEFRKYGEMLFNNNLINSAKIILGVTWPSFLKVFKISLIKPVFSKFFIREIRNVVTHRENNNVDRKDFMNMLIRMKNNQNIDDGSSLERSDHSITMNELLAQCFIFYIAGFETSSATMTYCIFELAQNRNIQDKLREEIRRVINKYNGKLTYDGIMEMQYLDQVISETLRKYPPLVVLNRICTKNYHIPDSDVVIDKGTTVFIPVLAIHYDPEYYPNPEHFDPERFTEEEKLRRKPFTYLPFGEGPRNCIGLRFGLIQTKIGIASLIRNYSFSLDNATKLPLKFKTTAVILSHYDTIWLKINKV